LEGNFLQFLTESRPERLGKHFSVIESIAYQIFHLLLEYTVEFLDRIVDDLFLLTLKLLLQLNQELLRPRNSPFLLVGYTLYTLFECFECLRFELLDVLNAFVFIYDLIGRVEEV
jgi:hypothetical protein